MTIDQLDYNQFMSIIFPDRGINNTPMDYTYFSNYNQDLGYWVGIDSIFNADPNYLYMVFVTSFPPGKLYETPPSKDHTMTFVNVDF